MKKIGSVFGCDVLVDTDEQRIADRAEAYFRGLIEKIRLHESEEADRKIREILSAPATRWW
jgi:hypothetical protein